MTEQSKYFIVRIIPGYEEDELTASALVVEITPKMRDMISEASKIIDELADRYPEVVSVMVDHSPSFLAPGETQMLSGHDNIPDEYEEFEERLFSNMNIISINQETFLKGQAMYEKNEVRFFSVHMYISATQVWWSGVYRNSDVRAISVGVAIGDLF